MTKNNKNITFLLAAFIAIVVFIFALWYSVRNRPTEPIQPPKEYNAAGAVIPEEIRAYNGIVKEIGNSEFILQASANENYFLEDSEIVVRYNENTQFVKNSVSKILAPDALFPSVIESPALPSDVAIGARIAAYANKNIAGEQNFLADKIILSKVARVKQR